MKQLIISLTTYGERLNTVHLVVDSLKQQTYRASKILLWLDETELAYEKIPEELRALEDELFEIRFCPNYKSYKKLIPTLNQFPDASIITFDDDIIIPPLTVQTFVEASTRFANTIIAARGRFILKDKNGTLKKYQDWNLITNSSEVIAEKCILPIGYGGILYPPRSLHCDSCDVDKFSGLADNADDIWFKCMALLNGFGTLILPRTVSTGYREIAGTQSSALYLTVNTEDRNIRCLNAIKKSYPTLDEIFSSDDFSYVKVTSDYLSEMQSMPSLFINRQQAAGFFREAALAVEDSNMRVALELMEKAKKCRPNGPLINRKIKEYKSKLNV
ncbi:hypothetical protein [Pseudoalteromonas lipolytica]